MSEKDLETWAVIRARGRRWVLTRFVAWTLLAFSVVMLLAFVLGDVPHLPPDPESYWSDVARAARFIVVNILFWGVLGGVVCGWIFWTMIDRLYREEASEQRRCSQCGYRTDGVGQRCPECGHEGEDQRK